jgi:uncharacterized protein (TIGR00661 family)
MKPVIAMSCSGEGWGHLSRVFALAEQLRSWYEISFWVPAPLLPLVNKRFPSHQVFEVPFLELVKEGHTIRYRRTLSRNRSLLLNSAAVEQNLAEMLRKHHVEALISDFEPYTVRGAKRAGIPSLNINHPSIVQRFPSPSLHSVTAHVVSRYMAPAVADKTVICSFYHGDVGPILRSELRCREPQMDDFILVYTKKESREQVLSAVNPYGRHERFEVFPNAEKDFAAALLSCKAIIAPAGHQTISEAICLGKPILAIPQKAQYEQQLNAEMLEASGRGYAGSIEGISKDIDLFLSNLHHFPFASKGKVNFTLYDDTAHAANAIRSFLSDSTDTPHAARQSDLDLFSTTAAYMDAQAADRLPI